MRVQLPEAYLKQMRGLLGAECDKFLASYEESRTYGLRLNPSKIAHSSELLYKLQEMFALEPVPWCSTGYYYAEVTRPGRHPYHAAGAYYIQEPSAMSAAELLCPQPGELVLDLAAAPGGKSTHIAAKMDGHGLLVANEIHPARAAVLAENIERMGIRNAVVTNAAPGQLAERFPAFFDRIMLDAPCSGEGMFRKEPETIDEWSAEQVAVCAARQADILRDAVKMLKPGGTLAYSTCTFNTEENERVIDWLTTTYPRFKVVRMERFWPHEQRGEGHFVAVLRLEEDGATARPPMPGTTEVDRQPRQHAAAGARQRGKQRHGDGASRLTERARDEAMQLFNAFAAEALHSFNLPNGEPLLFGEQLYWVPAGDGSFTSAMLDGLRAPRPGLHLGTARKGRFTPAHALAMALSPQQAASIHSLSADSVDSAAWLRGETLSTDHRGWTLVAMDGMPIGWGKASGGVLKNHVPKGLRRPL